MPLPLRALAVLLLVALVPEGWAQTASVSGTIRDAASGETLIGANVRIEGTSLGAATNAQGLYRIAGITPGTVTVSASFLGYDRVRETVTLEPGQTLRLDINLPEATVEAGEVVVEANVPLSEERAIGVQEVPIRLVQQIPSAVEADLFRSLQALPGIKAANDFSSQLYIRGGSPDQTLILLDQTTVYNPSHFFGFFSTFNTDAIKDVRVYKGGYPATYGGRLGSVLDVSNRDGNRNRRAGRVSLGILASRASIEGPISVGGVEGSAFVAGRRSTLEPLLAILRESEDFVPDGFYFYDLNAKVNLDPSPNDRLSLAFYTGLDDVQFPFAENSRFDLRYGNRTGSLRYTRILSDEVFATFVGTASTYLSTPDGTFSGTNFRRENRITDYSLKGDVEWVATSDVGLQGGFWAGTLTTRLDDFLDDRRTFGTRVDATYAQGYAQATWRPAPWTVTGGLRVASFSNGGYVRLEPRLSVDYTITSRVVLQAAVGRYHQFLSLVTNEAFTGFDVWVTTGEGVAPAYGDQLTLGLKTRPTDTWGIDVEAYYRTLRDLFELDPRVQDPAGLEYRELFRIGDGFATGAELLVERRRGRLTGFLGYTLGVTQRRFRGADGQPYNPDASGEPQLYSPKYDRTHDVSLVANVELGRGWELTGAFTYQTGQAYTRPVGYFEAETIPGTQGGVLVTSGYQRARLPAYHRLDVGLARETTLFGAPLEARVQLINLYSRRNVWFILYDFDENPIESTPVRQLPILPNLSITLDL